MRRLIQIIFSALLVGTLATSANATSALPPGPSPELLFQATVPQPTLPGGYSQAVLGFDYKLPKFVIGIGNSGDPTNWATFAPWNVSSSIGAGCFTVQTCSPVIEAWSIRSGTQVNFSVSRFQSFAGAALIEFNNSTSTDPADAGVLPGDQINFRVQPGIFTIPSQPAMNSMYLRFDFVFIRSGISNATPGVNGVAGTTTSGSVALYNAEEPESENNAPPAPNSVSYEGPLNLRNHSGTICSGGEGVLTGERLNTISEIYVGDKKVAQELLSDGRLKYSLKDISPGTYQIRYWVPVNNVNLTDQIRVGTCSNALVVTTQGAFEANKLFANYRGDRGPVLATDRAAITAFINQYKGITTVRCVGSTSGVPAKRTDQALATARAKNACDVVKRLVPNATISLETSTGKGIGQRFRSVTIFISGTN